MKKVFIVSCFCFSVCHDFAQEVLHVQNGGNITIQNGIELTLQGGIGLENGSNLFNNGTVRLKNNVVANMSDWIDNSAAGALSGAGIVIFNSINTHNFSGNTNFYQIQVNTGGLNLNNNFSISNLLNLVNGKINTGVYYVFLSNNNASSLLNDVSNAGYSHSWINGSFRRSITANTNQYDFPVGNSTRANLLQFLNNNVTGVNYLTASFGPKPGTDAGLNVAENAVGYTGVNNGGVWYLIPDANISSGNYALQLYFIGFTGLADNMFGILRRSDASSIAADWSVPVGSLIEATNGIGRKLNDGFARRFNISSFSQWGIGMTGILPCENCPASCNYTQGFYGNVNGTACYNNSGNSVSSTQLMLNAFGATSFKVFGSVANRRFFTLFKNDIVDKNIFKMLPGGGNSQPIAVDNTLPYDGAYYDDQHTWPLVPIQSTGQQKGKINNQLLSQTISLWFNLQTSNSLGIINLSNDTLLTAPQTSCGSGIISGPSIKFGLPHDVIVYLNGGNGYTNNVNGLFQLANDVLGGANSSLPPLDVQLAVATINSAFDGCRILTATIPFAPALLTKSASPEESKTQRLSVTAFPNPFNKQFNLNITSPVTGMAKIEFFNLNGARISEFKKFLSENISVIIPYSRQLSTGSVLYKVTIGNYQASGIVVSVD